MENESFQPQPKCHDSGKITVPCQNSFVHEIVNFLSVDRFYFWRMVLKSLLYTDEEYLGNDKPVNKITPVVSVSLTTYNHEAFIGQCLDGILMQKTTFPFEVIVGEDDSTDKTRDICKKYAEQHPDKIRLFLRDKKDKILVNGRQTGKTNSVKNYTAARGNYIAICDGDDYWTGPSKLEKQVNFLESHPEYVPTFHDAPIVDENDHFLSEGGLPDNLKKGGRGIDIIVGKWLPTLTVVFRNGSFEIPKEYFEVLNGDAFLCTLLGISEEQNIYRRYLPRITGNMGDMERPDCQRTI